MDGKISPDGLPRQSYLMRSGSHGNDRSRKLQSENDYLRDRIISCEKGLVSLYKVLHPPEQPHRGLTHHRSASFSRSRSPDASPSRMASTSALASESRRLESPFSKHVTIPELKETIEKVVQERDDLLSKIDDMRQITEAAKRERLLAIEEKDVLVKEAHDLKMAGEKADSAFKDVEKERSHLISQIQELEEANEVLRHGNQEARELQSNFLEERTKLLEEREAVHCELEAVQAERDELFEETVELQASLQQLANEKRKLLLELEWNSKRTSGYESIARKLKEQNEILNGRAHDILPITLSRHTPTMPWGFSIEGGRGSEFFHHDPSVVVTGIADKSPASSVLRFGDRVLTVNGRDFRNILRKEAAEILRTCDHLSITMEVKRCQSQLKTHIQEVKIPGKKTFGFTHESRLFISSVEAGGNASDWLLPGDEILQVTGKSAVNMKSSHFKQLLKSCKDGVTMMIRRLPEFEKGGEQQFRHKSPKSSTRKFFPSHSPQRLSNEFPPLSAGFPIPGTPGSTMSDSSAGYHSLTHSQPSTMSNVLSPNGQDFKTRGLTDLEEMEFENSGGGQFRSNSDQSGYETDQAATPELGPIPGQPRQRAISSSVPRPLSGFKGHHSEMYSHLRRYTASATSGSVPAMYGGTAPVSRGRATGVQGYGGLYSSLISPGLVPSTPNPFTQQQPPPQQQPGPRGSSLPRKIQPPSMSSYSKLQAISMSADNLDSDFPPPLPPPRRPLTSARGVCGSRDSRVTTPTTPTYPRPAFSMSNMQQQTHV